MHNDGDVTPASCIGHVQRVWAQCFLCVSLCAVILTGEKRVGKVLGNTCFSVTVMQLLVLYFHVAIYPSLPEIFVPYFLLAAVVSPLHLFSGTLLLKLCPDLERHLRILEILLSADSSRSISHELLAGLSIKPAWLSYQWEQIALQLSGSLKSSVSVQFGANGSMSIQLGL